MQPFLYRLLSKIAPAKKQRRYWKKRYRLCKISEQNDIRIPDNVLEHVELVIRGHDNKVDIGNIRFNPRGRLRIEIYGHNNNITIKDGVWCNFLNLTIGESYQNAPAAHNSLIMIGEGSTFQQTDIFTSHSNAQIMIGENCMFSYGVVIRHTDSHPIYELGSQKHINRVSALKIGNHVWVGWHVSIWKNVHIADDCILGAHAVVAKSFHEPHCAIAGNPARIIRRNIMWESAHTRDFIENKPD